ncbi:hypothetical protein MTR67_042707 [Solanum verrucosum]|uniref:DUF4283 domain-containing protein n=1 Tax=Solanum verrucosum TaxID=315347 RepID=A0AAF0ZRD7_SOLVR|nr:hypothetical protein MTR67_042707 [Solanum verrucosum]
MRTLKWDPLFNPEEETTTTIAWISFLALPPIFFGKDTIFSMAAAVGRPLQVDLETQNKTRPSCARVKVEVDLLGEFPKRINIGVRKKSWEVMDKWVAIKYDYIPKYCKTCKLQGYNEEDCYVIHPELFTHEEQKEEIEKEQKKKENKGTRVTLEEGKGSKGKNQEHCARGMEGKDNKIAEREFTEQGRRTGNNRHFQYQRRKPELVWNPKSQQGRKSEVETNNKFGALENTSLEHEEDYGEGLVDKQETHIQNEIWDKPKDNDRGTFNSNSQKGGDQINDSEHNISSAETEPGSTANVTAIQQEKQGHNTLMDKRGINDKENVLSGMDASAFPSPKLYKHRPQEIQEKQDTEEEEGMTANINAIGREGDLSPRQIELLNGRYGATRNNTLDMTYVNTKSRKVRLTYLD